MALLIFYVLLALSVSFLCSIMEAVLLSISPSYLAQMEKDNLKAGRLWKDLKKDVDRPLAAILSLNTIAHTVGAAGAGAQAAVVFGDAYLGVASGVLTLLILIVSEIIPKTLGAAYWRNLASITAVMISSTIMIMWPLVKMSEYLTRLLTKGKPKNKVHRDEFIALSEIGAKEGIFHKYEARLLQNLFYFREIRTRDIMTPRTVLFALQEDMTIQETLQTHPVIRFSRLPLYGEDLDDVKGFVLKNEILQESKKDDQKPLKELCRPIVVIPGDMNLKDLFEKMMTDSTHIALVVDSYGGTEGVVSMEDFLETLLGLEIVDEFDDVEDMQAVARKKWQERAKRTGLITDAVDHTEDLEKDMPKEEKSVNGDLN